MLQVQKTYYLLLLMGCFSSQAIAQTASSALRLAQDCDGKIEGTVHDTQHQSLPGVSIWLKELERGASTDLQGRYIFEGLCPGSYTLLFRSVGFQPQSKIIVVSRHALLIYDLELLDETIHLEQIEIQEDKITLEETSTQNTASLSGKELDRLQGKNLGSILQEITGVGVLQTGQGISKPVIQGMHSNRIQILNSGIRQEGQQWGMEHAPEIDPFLATDITLIKGAASVEYGGDAAAGAVIISPPALRTDKGMSATLNLVGMSNAWGGAASASIESSIGNIKGLAARVQGTYRRLGDSQAPKYTLSNTGLNELNFSAALGLTRKKYGIELFYSRFDTEIGILAAAHIGNTTDLYNAIRSGEPAIIRDFTYEILNPRQRVFHQLFKTEAFWKFSDEAELKVRYGLQINQRQEYDIRRGGRSERPSLDLQLLTHTLDASLEYSHHQFWKGKMGIQSMYQDNYNDVGLTGTRRLIPDYEKVGGGIFWIERLIKGKWEAELGLRYDYNHLRSYVFDRENTLSIPLRNFHNFASNVGFIYHPKENLTLRSNLGFSQRNPQVNELYSSGLHHAAAAIEEGDATLSAEKSIKWVGQATWVKKRWMLELSPYIHHFDNYIYLQPREIALTIRGAFPVFQYVQQQADFLGLDAMLRYELLPHLTLQSEISYLSATRGLIWINPSQTKHSIRYERPIWGKVKDFFAKIELVQVSRQNRAPDAIENIENIPEDFTDNFDFVAAPGAYHLLQFSVGSRIPLKNTSLTWGLEIENIFNTTYRNYMNRYRYFADEMGRNITLRFRYYFETNLD